MRGNDTWSDLELYKNFVRPLTAVQRFIVTGQAALCLKVKDCTPCRTQSKPLRQVLHELSVTRVES
jgi:hypothetical protein